MPRELFDSTAKTEKVIASVPVGPAPRFLAAGLGSVWVLNQDDGSVSRIDPPAIASRRPLPLAFQEKAETSLPAKELLGLPPCESLCP
jgi:hypothetical protein